MFQVPIDALWKWVYCNLVIKENGSTENEITKNQIVEDLLMSLGIQGDSVKTKVSRLLAFKAFSFLFPDASQAIEEIKDPHVSSLRHVRFATGTEREARASSVPPLTEEFKRKLLSELRTEITRRTSSNASSLVPKQEEDQSGPKRKAPSPPESPSSKRQKLSRRSSSEPSLFSPPTPPSTPSVSKLEQQLASLEQKQAALQAEINELRFQLQQVREVQFSSEPTSRPSHKAPEGMDDSKPSKVVRKAGSKRQNKQKNTDFEYEEDKEDSGGTFQDAEKDGSTEGSPNPGSPTPKQKPSMLEMSSLADAASALSSGIVSLTNGNGAEVPAKNPNSRGQADMNAALMMALSTSLQLNTTPMNLGSSPSALSSTVTTPSIPIVPVAPPPNIRYSPQNSSNSGTNLGIYHTGSSSWNPYSLSSGSGYFSSSSSSPALFAIPLSSKEQSDHNSPSPLPTKLSQETADSQASSQET